MQQVSIDFEDRVAGLSKKSRRTALFMTLMLVVAAISYALFALASLTSLPTLMSDSGVVGLVFGERGGNALWAANNFANVGATAALRIWWLRESKMTLLLSHAMILEDEAETAMRLLLSSNIKV